MTVAELIAKLQAVDPSRLVVMASDAEGNGYSPLYDLWTGAYKPDTTWSGQVGFESLTAEDRRSGYTDADVLNGQPAVILKPTN